MQNYVVEENFTQIKNTELRQFSMKEKCTKQLTNKTITFI